MNLRITLPLLLMRWHACKSLSFTFMPVKGRTLHTCSSRFWSEIDPGTGLISIISLLTYCAVLSAFFPSSITRLRRLLQFLETCNSEWSSFNFPKKSSNRLLKDVQAYLLYFQLVIICWLILFLRDFHVGILLQPY